MQNVLKATISGSFKASDGQIESFDRVEGYIPALDDDKAQQMIIKRYAVMWVGQALDSEDQPLYKRVQRVRQVFVDSVEAIEDDHDFAGKPLSYVGKAIMDMNYGELQDLAAANDLSAVPLYKTASLQQARRIAFAEYASKVLGWTELNAKGVEGPINWRLEGYNPSKYEPIIADGQIRRSGEKPVDIEESIDREKLVLNGKAKATETSKPRVTLDQLKAIADSKNPKITYNANIGFDALYVKIYGRKP